MAQMIINRMPFKVSPPGRILKSELDARGLDQKDLAEIIGRPESAISQIVTGEKEITPQTADELSEALGISAQFWINLQANYNLWRVQQESRESEGRQIARRARIYKLGPVRELRKKGWIKDTNDVEELEKEMMQFLGIKSPQKLPECRIAARRGVTRDPETVAQICWVKRVEHLVANQKPGKFSLPRFRDSIPDLLELSRDENRLREIPRFLIKHGVRFAIVPHLSRTCLDGALFRMNGNPVIALTLRYDRIDAFWFTLLHEIAHLVAGHKGDFLDTVVKRENKVTGREAEADRMAMNWLVDEKPYKSFVEQASPRFSTRKIAAFAETIGRHPGLVLGRLHYDGHVPYRNLRKLLLNVKPFLDVFFDKPILV